MDRTKSNLYEVVQEKVRTAEHLRDSGIESISRPKTRAKDEGYTRGLVQLVTSSRGQIGE